MLTHYLFELCFLSHALIFSVYWPVLHRGAIEKNRGTVRELTCYTNHIMPQLAFLANYYVTDITLVPEHAHYIALPTGLVFCIVNCVTVVGRIIYPNPYFFVGNWDSMKSPLV